MMTERLDAASSYDHAASIMSRAPSSSAGAPRTSSSSTSSHATALSPAKLTLTERLLARTSPSTITTMAGGLAGAVSGIVSCPLDVIKTKLQAQGGFRPIQSAETGVLGAATYRGFKGTAATIWHEEGLRGLYRGLGPMMLGYIPTWAVYLTVYKRAQEYCALRTESTFRVNMYSAVAAGTCSTLVTNPIWVIKTRLMSQSGSAAASHQGRAPWYYRSTLDACRKMYRSEGMSSFYSGLTPALLGLTHVAIQFPLYEYFKLEFTGLQGDHTSPADKSSHFLGLSLAVFLSKVIASTVTYPHEVVRTRLQTQQRHSHPYHALENLGYRGTADPLSTQHSTAAAAARGHRPRTPTPTDGAASSDGMRNTRQYRGTWQTCRMILLEEGWRGFYAGLGTNLIRAVPSAMTTILTFEYLKKAFLARQRSGLDKLEGA